MTAPRKAILGTALVAALGFSQAHAALTLTDAFDGGWADLSHPSSARGWVFDVLAAPNGTRTLYMSGYLYDADGNPIAPSEATPPAAGEPTPADDDPDGQLDDLIDRINGRPREGEVPPARPPVSREAPPRAAPPPPRDQEAARPYQ